MRICILLSSNGGTGIHFILYVYKECKLALFVYHDEQNTFKNSREELRFSVVEVQRSANIRENDMSDIPVTILDRVTMLQSFMTTLTHI